VSRAPWRFAVPLFVVIMTLFGVPLVANAASPGIEGVITNARTGEPVVGAWVEAYNSSGGHSGGGGTDESGRYDLDWLSPGTYRVKVIANDFVDQWAFGRSDYASADAITAPGSASLALVPFQYGSVSGTFVSASGTPVAAAGVNLYDLSQNRVDGTSTDADGAFRFARIRAGQYKVEFLPGGQAAQWAYRKAAFWEADAITVAADTETVVAETAFDTGSLEVTVLDETTGAPVADACLNADTGPQHLFRCTGADGRAAFPDITVGTYGFSIAPPAGYLYGRLDGIVVSTGQTTATSTTLLAEATIEVVIKDATTREPVAGACVVVTDEQSNGVVTPSHRCSGADGLVRFDQYWPGRYRLYVYSIDGVHGSQWVGLNGGTGDLEQAVWVEASSGATRRVPVRLDAAGSITGLVRTADTGQPVAELCPFRDPGRGLAR